MGYLLKLYHSLDYPYCYIAIRYSPSSNFSLCAPHTFASNSPLHALNIEIAMDVDSVVRNAWSRAYAWSIGTDGREMQNKRPC